MHNNLKNKITFLLGAGASAPFVKYNSTALTTEYLTNSLLNPKNWKNILNKFEENKLENQLTKIDINDIIFIVNKINNILEKKEIKNFEYIIYLLDKISIYLSKEYNSIDNIDILLIDFFHQIDNELLQFAFRNSNIDGWKYAPFLAREVIIYSILDLWNNQDGQLKKDSNSLNQNFYKKILDKFKSVNIYSLNYDPLIYESLKENKFFSTGFNNTIQFNSADFNSADFFYADSIIAFIHGHVGFYPINSNDRVKFSDEYYKQQTSRIYDIFNNNVRYNELQGMKGKHYNTYLITGLDKIDAFSLNPFSSYIHRFSKDVIESDYIVLVGVSLSDYHLNSFLTNALFISGQNKYKKIIIVTKLSIVETESRLKIENNSDSNLIIKIISFFKDPITIPKNDGIEFKIETYYESILLNLKKGHTKISDNIVLYIKGTEEFYNEESLCSLFD